MSRLSKKTLKKSRKLSGGRHVSRNSKKGQGSNSKKGPGNNNTRNLNRTRGAISPKEARARRSENKEEESKRYNNSK